MFTINFKGKANPKDPKMVKLEMIIFKTGYARVTKVLNVSGPLKDWDNQSQSFKGNSSTLTAKNKILFELKNQYQKVADKAEKTEEAEPAKTVKAEKVEIEETAE